MGIAVVTGASSGIGEQFARLIQHEPEIDEIWLVARRGDRLEQLAGELDGARGVPIVADLANGDEVAALAERFAEAGPDLRVLINNAGFSVSGPIAERPLDALLGMVDLNVRALLHLTRVALDHMTSGARIIQVSSSTAFYPIPGFAVYAATKAFVLNFTVSLASEIKSRGIHAMVVCPGPVVTEFWDVATQGKHEAPPVLSMSAERLARIALRHSRGWRWISVPGVVWWLTAAFARLAPWRISATVVRWFNPY